MSEIQLSVDLFRGKKSSFSLILCSSALFDQSLSCESVKKSSRVSAVIAPSPFLLSFCPSVFHWYFQCHLSLCSRSTFMLPSISPLQIIFFEGGGGGCFEKSVTFYLIYEPFDWFFPPFFFLLHLLVYFIFFMFRGCFKVFDVYIILH